MNYRARSRSTQQTSAGAGAFSSAVGKNALANLIVSALVALTVRLFDITDTGASACLLAAATVALFAIGRFGIRARGSEVLINVLANIFANSIVLFVPPVNEWIRAAPIALGILIGLVGVPLVVLATFAIDTVQGPGCGIVLALPIAATSLTYAYVGLTQPGVSNPTGFAFYLAGKWALGAFACVIMGGIIVGLLGAVPVGVALFGVNTGGMIKAILILLWVAASAMALFFFPWMDALHFLVRIRETFSLWRFLGLDDPLLDSVS